MINLISKNALAKELGWTIKRLKKYLEYYNVYFSTIYIQISSQSFYINKEEFYRIKNDLDKKEDNLLEQTIEKISNVIKPKRLKKRRFYRSTKMGSNGRTLTENTLKKGKIYHTVWRGILNPAKFSNLNTSKLKKLG